MKQWLDCHSVSQSSTRPSGHRRGLPDTWAQRAYEYRLASVVCCCWLVVSCCWLPAAAGWLSAAAGYLLLLLAGCLLLAIPAAAG